MLTGDPQALNCRIGNKTVKIGTARVTSIIPDSRGVGSAAIEITIGGQTFQGTYTGGSWDVFCLNKEDPS